MSLDNIRFTKNNMSIKDRYFFMFDEDADLLLQKVDDGTTAFSYPLEVPLANEVIDTEFDGVNFWTLENLNPNVIIKRWFIENYICKLKTTLNFTADVGHSYSADAFAVENYDLTISGTCVPGTQTIYITDGYQSKLMSGMAVTLGPNYYGYSETITVSESVNGRITLTDGIVNSYGAGDPIQFYSNLFLFNNFDGKDETTAALYKINAYSGGFIVKYTGSEYGNVKASKFIRKSSFLEYGTVDALMFVKGTNLLFINIDELGTLNSVYGSMVIDNLIVTTGVIVDVHDIDVYGDNIYKLQMEGCKFGESIQFNEGASYMIEPYRPFLTSLNLASDPGVLAANGVDSTSLKAIALNQYGEPVVGRLVYFQLDTATQYVPMSITGPNPAVLDANGVASTTLMAGVETGWAKLVATVDQA